MRDEFYPSKQNDWQQGLGCTLLSITAMMHVQVSLGPKTHIRDPVMWVFEYKDAYTCIIAVMLSRVHPVLCCRVEVA